MSSSSSAYAFKSSVVAPGTDPDATRTVVPYVDPNASAMVPFVPGGTTMVRARGNNGCTMREQSAYAYDERGVTDQVVSYHLPTDHQINGVGKYITKGTR